MVSPSVNPTTVKQRNDLLARTVGPGAGDDPATPECSLRAKSPSNAKTPAYTPNHQPVRPGTKSGYETTVGPDDGPDHRPTAAAALD